MHTVTMDGVVYDLVERVVVPVQENEFVLGDFVQVKWLVAAREYGIGLEGMYGKVIYINDNNLVGVEFPFSRQDFHSCNERTKYGHGYYIEAKNLRKVKEVYVGN